MLTGKPVDPAGGRMEAELELIKRKILFHPDHQLAIQQKAPRSQRLECGDDVRKISAKRLARFRLQLDLAVILLGKATETLPFGFVLPHWSCGQLRGSQ
jgi:hypothetical protein